MLATPAAPTLETTLRMVSIIHQLNLASRRVAERRGREVFTPFREPSRSGRCARIGWSA